MMQIRPATADDLPLLYHWNAQPHVIKARGNDDQVNWKLELSSPSTWPQTFLGVIQNRPVGVTHIIDPAEEETGYWGRVEPDLRAIDIWIGQQQDLNKGYGTKMMRLAINHCFEDEGVNAILVDPLEDNKDAHRFYERLGFTELGLQKFGNDNCRVFRLERSVWYKPY